MTKQKLNSNGFVCQFGLGEYLLSNTRDENRLEQIEKQLSELTIGVEKNARECLEDEKIDLLFDRLDPSFLSMRGKSIDIKGCRVEYSIISPKFAVHSLDNPYSVISLKDYVFGNVNYDINQINVFKLENKIHPVLKERLLEATEKNVKYSSDYYYCPATNIQIELQSEFRGIIPRDVKEKIQNHSSLLDDLVIISEANWNYRFSLDSNHGSVTRDYDGSIKLSPPDPLLVGIRNNRFYLISEFDTTPIERYVVREFKSKVKGGHIK